MDTAIPPRTPPYPKKGRLYHTPRKSIFSEGKRRLEMQYFKAAVILQSRTAFAQVLFDILNRFDNVHFCNRAQRDRRCQQAGRNRNHSSLYNRHDGNGNKL